MSPRQACRECWEEWWASPPLERCPNCGATWIQEQHELPAARARPPAPPPPDWWEPAWCEACGAGWKEDHGFRAEGCPRCGSDRVKSMADLAEEFAQRDRHEVLEEADRGDPGD